MTTVLVTGEPGTGKTSLLMNLSRRLHVAGVISRPRVDEFGKRTDIVAVFPDTGEQIDLATVARIPQNADVARLLAEPTDTATDSSAATGTGAGDGVMVGPWRFSPLAITSVNARLTELAGIGGCTESSLADRPVEEPLPPCPVVLIDEIGPLELLRHGGFLPGLAAVMRSALPAIVVVRPALVAELRRTIGSFSNLRSPQHLHTVTIAHPAHIDPTATRILAMLRGL